MSKKPIVFEQFSGGWSTDLKVGIKNSQAYTRAFDFRKQPSQMSVLPGLTREDNNIVKDLIVNEVIDPSGNIYAFGNTGYFYKRNTSNTWSVEGKLASGTYGMDYRKDTDAIYLTSNKTVSLYNPVSGKPFLVPDKYGPSVSTYDNSVQLGFNVSANQSGSPNTTNILTTNGGSPTEIRYFQTDIEPMNKLQLFIANKGTGNWTVTVQDGLDNILGTSTVPNANLINGQLNDFNFTTAPNGQVRLYVAPNARTYHFYVTSTVADGSVQSLNTNDLSGCDLMIYADRLVQTQNGFHPMARFEQYEAIGNGNYLSVWEPLSDPPTNAEWLRHKLVFPQEYECCGLAVLSEYIAIACERIPNGTNGTAQGGIIFWWDGLSPTYNYFTEIPEGSPYGIREYQNTVYYYAGGAEYAIASYNSLPVKIRTMPGSDTEFSGSNNPIIVYPYTATVRRGIHLIGYPSSTTNTGIQFGVYSWGAVDKNLPQSFGYSYVISTGTTNYSAQNNLTIGMVKNFGDTLHVAWRDDLNGGYGIDVVNNASGPAPLAKWDSLIFDGGYVAKLKSAIYMETYYYMPPGCTIQMKYKIDRSTNWTYDPNIYSSTNLWQGQSNYARFGINNSSATGGRFHELQIGIEVVSTGLVSPAVYMNAFVPDSNQEEDLA